MVVRATQCRVRLANNSEYGLVAYVFTRDLNRDIRMGDRLETGMLGLNAGVISNAAAPFGGVKQSGLSSEAASKASRSTSTPSTLAPPTRTRARRIQPLSPPTEITAGVTTGTRLQKNEKGRGGMPGRIRGIVKPPQALGDAHFVSISGC